ncbi:hypothetical protein Bbelb_241110 [Branchiostoma belcheri]|nr:hypothetical protein Bbelb_241110 [Branchiostoma belcheri]
MWKDTRTLILFDRATDVQVTRRSKGRGRSAARLKEPCPAMVDLYNRYYKANKVVVNAYLDWKAYTSERSREKLPAHNNTQLIFRRALVRQRVGNFSARRRAPASNPPVFNPGTGPVIGEHEQVRRGKPTRACRYCAKAHRLMPGARRLRPHETVYKCNTCNVSVCRVFLRLECWREHLEEMLNDGKWKSGSKAMSPRRGEMTGSIGDFAQRPPAYPLAVKEATERGVRGVLRSLRWWR